jgi:hypothetical protein
MSKTHFDKAAIGQGDDGLPNRSPTYAIALHQSTLGREAFPFLKSTRLDHSRQFSRHGIGTPRPHRPVAMQLLALVHGHLVSSLSSWHSCGTSQSRSAGK